MILRSRRFLCHILFFFLLGACGTTPNVDTPTTVPATITPTSLPLPSLSITLGSTNDSQGITLDQGGDVDTTVDSNGNPSVETRGSGNGAAISAADGNNTPDSYLQFNVNDKHLFGGKPTSHVRVEVDYFDSGKDSFSLQYDAQSGPFAGGGSVGKTNTDTFKTAAFNLCDANFANRDNGADFRISDNGDGAEFIRSVRVIGLASSGAQTVRVEVTLP